MIEHEKIQSTLKSALADGRKFDFQLNPQEGLKIHLDSTQLSLSDKIAIEKKLKNILSEEFETLKLTINFRSFSLLDFRKDPSRGPAPVSKEKSAYGFTQAKRAIPYVRRVIAVASGKGGVGKSTISVNVAAALALQGERVGLLDADIYGPSVPLMLGLGGELKIDSEGKLLPAEAHGIKAVSFGFFSDAKQPVVWRGPLIAKAFEQFCYDVAWGDLDTLVIDLPPGTGDVQLTLAEKLPIHGALVVTTPQDVALIDAHKAITMFEKLGVPVLGVVENMAHYICGSCGHREHIFGDQIQTFCEQRNIKLLASIPLQTSIRMLADSGTPIALEVSCSVGAAFGDIAQHLRGQSRVCPPGVPPGVGDSHVTVPNSLK